MPHLFFKCPHMKPDAFGRKSYARYIALREGAVRIPREQRTHPATTKQQTLIESILQDYPDAKSSFEYADYLENPTTGNASEFITLAMEDNYNDAAGREGYVSYIAERPRAEHVGEHALFGAHDGPVSLDAVSKEIDAHPGVVWAPILSLRREDARHLGMDNPQSWRTFLMANMDTFSKGLKIPLDDLVWYAAYHDEGNHPHVHMLCYAKSASNGFLAKSGIRAIRSELTNDMFSHELQEVYARQTLHRNETGSAARAALLHGIAQMRDAPPNESLAVLMEKLAGKLLFHSGKLVYGYLRPPVKAIVNEIVDVLEKDALVSGTYAKWWDAREEILHGYHEREVQRVPLSQNDTFKQVRNMVVKEAVRLMREGEVFYDSPNTQSIPEKEAAGETAGHEEKVAGVDVEQAPLPCTPDVAQAPEDKPPIDMQPSAPPPALEDQDEWHHNLALSASVRLLYGLAQIFAQTAPRPASPQYILDQKRRKELRQNKGGKGIAAAEINGRQGTELT